MDLDPVAIIRNVPGIRQDAPIRAIHAPQVDDDLRTRLTLLRTTFLMNIQSDNSLFALLYLRK